MNNEERVDEARELFIEMGYFEADEFYMSTPTGEVQTGLNLVESCCDSVIQEYDIYVQQEEDFSDSIFSFTDWLTDIWFKEIMELNTQVKPCADDDAGLYWGEID